MGLRTLGRPEGPGPGFLAPASCARMPLGRLGPRFSLFNGSCLPVPLSLAALWLLVPHLSSTL